MTAIQPTIDITPAGVLLPGTRFDRRLTNELLLQFESTEIKPPQIVRNTAPFVGISLAKLRKALVAKRGWIEIRDSRNMHWFFLTAMNPDKLKEQSKQVEMEQHPNLFPSPAGQRIRWTPDGRVTSKTILKDQKKEELYQTIELSNGGCEENEVEGNILGKGTSSLATGRVLHRKLREPIGDAPCLKNLKELKLALTSNDFFASLGFYSSIDSNPAKKVRTLHDAIFCDADPYVVTYQHLILGPGAYQDVEIKREIGDEPFLEVKFVTTWPKITQTFYLNGENPAHLELHRNYVKLIDDRRKDRPKISSTPPEPEEAPLPKKIHDRLKSTPATESSAPLKLIQV